jgi:hypothetical protein
LNTNRNKKILNKLQEINVYSYLIAIKEYRNENSDFGSKLEILQILKDTADQVK